MCHHTHLKDIVFSRTNLVLKEAKAGERGRVASGVWRWQSLFSVHREATQAIPRHTVPPSVNVGVNETESAK
jgi:hypothetical protein